jgi:hypothetical protein
MGDVHPHLMMWEKVSASDEGSPTERFTGQGWVVNERVEKQKWPILKFAPDDH